MAGHGIAAGSFAENFLTAFVAGQELKAARIKVQQAQILADKKLRLSLTKGILGLMDPENDPAEVEFGVIALANAVDIDPKSPFVQNAIKLFKGLSDERREAWRETISETFPSATGAQIKGALRLFMSGKEGTALEFLNKGKAAREKATTKKALKEAIKPITPTRTVPAITKQALPEQLTTKEDIPGAGLPLPRPELGPEVPATTQTTQVRRVPESEDFLVSGIAALAAAPDNEAGVRLANSLFAQAARRDLTKSTATIKNSLRFIAEGKPQLADPRITAQIKTPEDAEKVLKRFEQATSFLEILSAILQE